MVKRSQLIDLHEKALKYSRMHQDMVSDYDIVSIRMGNVREGNMVLAAGVGTRNLAPYLTRVWNVFSISVDASERVLETVNRRTHEKGDPRRAFLLRASTNCLPIREKQFNAVISISAINDLSADEILRVFQEFARVLTEEGRFVLVEDWAFDPKSQAQQTLLELRSLFMKRMGRRQRQLNHREYADILQKAGFEIEQKQFLPKEISLREFDILKGEKAKELLQTVDECDPSQLHTMLTVIGSRVKR